MLNEIEQFYLDQEEPLKSCLLVLRDIILGFDEHISESWKYGMPFFMYKKKIFCYFWQDKKTKQPYIGIVEGWRIDHPMLVQGKRIRIKIFYVDPNEDIPIEPLLEVFTAARSFYK